MHIVIITIIGIVVLLALIHHVKKRTGKIIDDAEETFERKADELNATISGTSGTNSVDFSIFTEKELKKLKDSGLIWEDSKGKIHLNNEGFFNNSNSLVQDFRLIWTILRPRWRLLIFTIIISHILIAISYFLDIVFKLFS